MKLEKRLNVATMRLVWRAKEKEAAIEQRDLCLFGLDCFFVCVWLQIFVCTHILFIQEKLPKKTPFSFLFGKVILVLVFGFYFVREQILSQAMNAHTCFRRKQMRHFFFPLGKHNMPIQCISEFRSHICHRTQLVYEDKNKICNLLRVKWQCEAKLQHFSRQRQLGREEPVKDDD